MISQFDEWVQKLEARHLADLRFPELTRAVRALSSVYVERRGALADGAAFSGAGKRAAFALFYGPLHHMVTREIVSAIPGATAIPPMLLDLGCGTGAAGAAWASLCGKPPAIKGIDRHPWAVREARLTYREFGLPGRTDVGDIATTNFPAGRAAILAAFVVNELPGNVRDLLLPRLMDRAARGDHVLVIEPLAKSSMPWWQNWSRAFESVGGRSDEWRFSAELPAVVSKLDRAAGLDHRRLTGRSLWIGRPSASGDS